MVLLCACSSQATLSNRAPSSTELAGGPLQDSLEGDSRFSLRGLVDDGCRVSFGDTFRNVTDEPVVVTDAQFEVSEGVTVLGIMRLPEGSRGVGNPPGFPPRELKSRWPRVRELVGSTVDPGEYALLVVGLYLESKRGVVMNLAIGYEIGGRRYRAVDNDVFEAVSAPEVTCGR